jgi:regulator of sigma D
MSQSGTVGFGAVSGCELVDKLLAMRQEMLVKFCTLAGLEPYSRQAPMVRHLQEFCQSLIDYTAFGHFEMLRDFAESPDGVPRAKRLLEQVYPGISETTAAAVAFNDRYDASDHALNLDHLPRDLSLLGERIAARIELEDRVLRLLLEHCPQ